MDEDINATKAEICQQFHSVREQTEQLCRPLLIEDYVIHGGQMVPL